MKARNGKRYLSGIKLQVPTYEEGIAFYVGVLGFTLVEDTPLENGKRWIILRPSSDAETTLVLGLATSEKERAAVGRQAGESVFLFLTTDSFDEDRLRYEQAGVVFTEAPRTEPYGRVAVFEDPFGNRWDLLEQSTIDYKIRPEAHEDVSDIRGVIAAAFANGKGTENDIVDRLRRNGTLEMSLVAERDGRIIGHVAFSPVRLNGEPSKIVALGPLAVHPNNQGNGIGSRLVRTGLAKMAAAGATGCVVLGDPKYYSRFGFEVGTGVRAKGLPDAYFQYLSFDKAAVVGNISYDAAFGLAD